MREVACKGLDMFFRELRRRRLPPDLLAEGTGYSVAHLRNKHERIEWDSFRRMMQNGRAVWSDEDFIEMGGAFTRNPFARSIIVIARLLFGALDFYKWVATPGKGPGNQLFTCVEPSYREIGPNQIQIQLNLKPGYEPCREFFLVSKGSFIYLPRILGLGVSQIEMLETGRGARFDIVYPNGGGLLARLFRIIIWPFTVLGAARELKEANEILQERYTELEDARRELDRQARQLRTAHSISRVIHSDLDLDRTLGAVVRALIDVGGFIGAEVVVCADLDGQRIERRAEAGHLLDDEGELSIPIEVRGRYIGQLRLWSSSAADLRERFDMLEYVTPAISVALDDALTYTAVADYRANLEQKVVERTSDLERARDDLAATVESLREAQTARDRIFANINHEIRTPLSLVMLAVSAIQSREGQRLDERSCHELASIELCVRRLLRLIDGLLLLAAGQEGKLALHFTHRDVALVLRQLVLTWSVAAEGNGLRLGYEGPSRCSCEVDESALEHIVTNLLSNAIKFTPSGGSVQVELAERDAEIEISVRDSGIGIDEEFRRRIFGRFEQGRPAVHAGAHGSGIGLSVVKQLVEAHGGTVSVENPRNGGSVFRVVLPRLARLATNSGSTRELGTARLTSQPLGPNDFGVRAVPEPAVTILEPAGVASATILVAEDEPELRQAIARLLCDRYRVLVAADGINALHLARRHRPDLLVSDVGMPGMDGLELTRRFRALPGNELAPVLLLTAYGNVGDRLTGFTAGASDYVTKPFVPEELRARIESQLAMRDLALKLHQSEKLAALGVLSAGLAHELRNPANALVNAIPPLRSLLPSHLLTSGTPTAQLLDVMESCGAQIGMLARQLLGFKRPGELAQDEQSFPAILSRALAVVQPALHGVALHNLNAYHGTLRCAGPLVMQVLVNLVENAAQAAGSGGWVRVGAHVEGSSLVVEVRDSGPGVSPELRERIFEPFFTTKPPGKGTGLGLTTSREIAERHGGSLTVRDHGPGSVFQLMLPLHASTEAALPLRSVR